MAFDLDLSTVRATAKNTLATPWLMAKVANVAKVAKESAPNQPKPPETLATLAGLATLAISQQRLKTFQEATAEPAQPSPEAAPAPPKAVSQWCDVGQPLRTSEATDQVPPTPKKALAIDPGKRALLALVATYCDRTGASDKARAQWMQSQGHIVSNADVQQKCPYAIRKLKTKGIKPLLEELRARGYIRPIGKAWEVRHGV